jgi:signal transduction histidine kinase/ligand-binding sensor domain-containing protein
MILLVKSDQERTGVGRVLAGCMNQPNIDTCLYMRRPGYHNHAPDLQSAALAINFALLHPGSGSIIGLHSVSSELLNALGEPMRHRTRSPLTAVLLMSIVTLASCGWRSAPLPTIIGAASVAQVTRGDDDEPAAAPVAGGAARAHLNPTQRPATADQKIHFERLSVQDGLSHSTVRCIIQDKQGFLWFGTDDGLNRYDGYDFRVFKHDPEDPGSLSTNAIASLLEDTAGILWVGTYGGGLDRFDPRTGEFTHHRHDPAEPDSLADDRVRSVYEDRSGILWVATHGGGLDSFDPQEGRFTHHQPDPADPFSLPDLLIDSIYEDREGTLWIGSNNEGLVQHDPATGRFYRFQHTPGNASGLSSNLLLTAIVEADDGMLWIASVDGLNRFDRRTERFVTYHHDPTDPNSLSHDGVNTIHQDSSGTLWIGTTDGLNRFIPETDNFIQYRNDPSDPYSLSDNLILSIIEDRAGSLWIGTMGGGVARADPFAGRFRHYLHHPGDPDSLGNNIVNAIWQDGFGSLWVGTYGGGLDRFDRESGQWRHFRHDPGDPSSLSDDIVTAITGDPSGEIWIGTAFGGLNRFDPKAERFERFEPALDDPAARLRDGHIRTLCRDGENTLWIGTHGDGLSALELNTGQFFHWSHDSLEPSSLSDNWIYALDCSNPDVLWVGTRGGGLSRLDRQAREFSRYRHDPADPGSISSDTIWAIHEDREGVLWIGTGGGGLNKLSPGNDSFYHYGTEDGLPGSTVVAILEDGRGNLWLATDNGLSRFDPRNETFRNYDIRDGLQGNVFISGASFLAADGEIFVGGFDGFNTFYPDLVHDNPVAPPVALTSLTQNGRQIEVGTAFEHLETLTLRQPESFFEFAFAALNFTQPEKNQYAYRLEGLETEWQFVGTRRWGSYANLPVGSFTLHIKASNNDGVWNEDGISLEITVVPPFWETWWFRGIASLALLAVAGAFFRLRLRSLQERSRKLEGVVATRTSELEALYLAGERMYRHLDLDQVLQALVDVAVDVLHADKSAVFLLDREADRWKIHVARNFGPQAMEKLSFALGEGNIGRVAASGEPVLVDNAITAPEREIERPEAVDAALSDGIRSFMHLPIKVGSETFGICNVSFSEPHAFGQTEPRIFQALVERASLAIENAQLHQQAQELAAVEERQRLARDLHDAVTQTLFSTSLIAEVLPLIWEQNSEDGRHRLQQIRQGTRSALAEMRALLLELRPSGLADAEMGDLLSQAGEAISARSGIPVSVQVLDDGDEGAVPAEVRVGLYRIAQEALNNVARHSHAGEAIVLFRNRAGSIELSIADDGRGFAPGPVAAGHLGIGIMRERAEEIDARLEIESELGSGTRVTVVWPAGQASPLMTADQRTWP